MEHSTQVHPARYVQSSHTYAFMAKKTSFMDATAIEVSVTLLAGHRIMQMGAVQ